MKTSRGVIALVAAIVGASLMSWSFVTGIDAALSGAGSGALLYEIVFIVAGVLVVAALVFAIVQLVKRQGVLLPILTIVAALIPLSVVVFLALSARG